MHNRLRASLLREVSTLSTVCFLLLCGTVLMGLFELQILIVEFVRGVKKFIFACRVTSCHVLSTFQQLRWYFSNERKRVLHTNLL